MNYSKPTPKKRRDRADQIAFFLSASLIAGLFLGVLFAILISKLAPRTEQTKPPEIIAEIPPDFNGVPEPEALPLSMLIAEENPEPTPVLLGEFRVTAYCPCEICCGKWANDRPGGIVYGAYGVELKAGKSCASPLPGGTVLEVEGLGEYIVQDKIADWVIEKYGENQIDIYFDTHEAACEFGCQKLKVYMKEENQ